MMELAPIIIIFIIIVLLIRNASKKKAEAQAKSAAAKTAGKTVTKVSPTSIRVEPKPADSAKERKAVSYKVAPDAAATQKLHIKMQEEKRW